MRRPIQGQRPRSRLSGRRETPRSHPGSRTELRLPSPNCKLGKEFQLMMDFRQPVRAHVPSVRR